MLRRSFLKLTGAASIAFAVGVEHFHPAPSIAEALKTAEPVIEIETGVSPVLEALRLWNDARWKDFGGSMPTGEIVWTGTGWVRREG